MAEKKITMTESELKALVASMVAEQVAAEKEKAEPEPEPANTEANRYENELVTIKIHKDKTHVDDVFVGLNGRFWMIKRGVEVQVPRAVKEILDHQEEQESIVVDLISDGEKKLDDLLQQ